MLLGTRVFILVLTYQLLPLARAFSSTDAGNLEDALLSGYHTMVRPNTTVSISIEFGMYQINALDNVDQTLSVTGVLLLYWMDHRLAWDPTSYGGMESTHLRADQIWVPPLVFSNSAEDIDIISDDSDTRSTPLYIGKDGFAVWLAAVSCLLSCTVDITYYPFDEQKCHIQVGTWMYSATEVDLTKFETESNQPINLELYEENGEWEITKTSVEFNSRSMHGHAMSQATFSVYLARKHSYYIFNIILPVVFISFLGCLVFALPVESGEKNGFSLTILLSLTVVLTMVSDKIPTTSINLCVLSVYLLCTVMLSALEVSFTVLVQTIHVQTRHGHKLSTRMKRLTGSLAKMIRYSKKKQGNSTRESDVDTCKLAIISPKSETPKKSKVLPKTPPLTDNYMEMDDCEKYEYEDLANILDKMCFVLFFLITVIITSTFQIMMAVGR